ncbi:EF-hand domain-containing protein [Sulfitobacter donghicola]|uniref:Calcium sensor EFh n=1 Tax=Sulfitobacter donghicola DSW-25 = KCTC 12864 = JCM 14565 TaxID=1300350 RepID=A0A073II48_9RHOB|nr:EF-hand domain-containing protein [Sulfitobacter donghicola]KEJ89240.1 calcium sensor EFh [Sulfitobacter donghicola DSW-25 = KCTC 12864 = JCM 14565]KIN69034.1 EF hand domain protein [Sulfitobacter donghicola DSW-25 = KCTC 12864 = JCM 14565]
MFKETMTALAIVAGLVATTAQARDGGEGMQARFAQIDANGDGEISAEELQAQVAARFAAADANKDGALTADEMMAAREGKHKERLLKRFDKNGDGALSGEELDEMSKGKGGKKGDKKGGRAAKHFERMDADNSGDLTLEEMQSHRDPAKMFEKLDADKSGGLSEEEFAKARGHGKHKKNHN